MKLRRQAWKHDVHLLLHSQGEVKQRLQWLVDEAISGRDVSSEYRELLRNHRIPRYIHCSLAEQICDGDGITSLHHELSIEEQEQLRELREFFLPLSSVARSVHREEELGVVNDWTRVRLLRSGLNLEQGVVLASFDIMSGPNAVFHTTNDLSSLMKLCKELMMTVTRALDMFSGAEDRMSNMFVDDLALRTDDCKQVSERLLDRLEHLTKPEEPNSEGDE